MNKYYTGVGARATPIGVLERMSSIAVYLDGFGFKVRSGGANGADSAFEEYTENSEIFLPWNGFNNKREDKEKYFCYNNKEPNGEAYEIAKSVVTGLEYRSSGVRLLHTRNVYQVLGHDLNTPSKFVVCWTEGGKMVGGTATALRLAEKWNIPICNLAVDKFSDFVKRENINLKED